MSAHFIRDVEAVASRIMDADNAKDLIFSLQSLFGRAALMRLCRKGVLDADELARLMPPDRAYTANAARDYLLGAIYEMQRAREKEQPFRAWEGEDEPEPDVPSVVRLAQEIGASIAADERAIRYGADKRAMAPRVAICSSREEKDCRLQTFYGTTPFAFRIKENRAVVKTDAWAQ